MEGSEDYTEAVIDVDDAVPRRVPTAHDAERAVLGAIINRNIAERKHAVSAVSAFLRPEHFHEPRNRTIYKTVLALYERGGATDEISLTAELERSGDLGRCGGMAYVLAVADTVFTDANAENHARIVVEKAALRTIAKVGESLQSQAYGISGDISALIESANNELMAANTKAGQTIHSAADVALKVLERIDGYARGDTQYVIKSPFADLNNLITGFRPKELFVIAARPGSGKSALAHILALHAAGPLCVPVGIITLEMARDDVVERMACTMARVDSKALREGRVTQDELTAVGVAVATIGSMPLYFEENYDADPMTIRSMVRRMTQRVGVKMVIVDHMQKIKSPKKAENRQQGMSEISGALANAAKESDVALIALSQLNRNTEKAGDGRPGLADLRESGTIEQDADSVMFIYHRAKYKDAALKNQAEIIVAKQRYGPTDSCFLEWTPQHTRFSDWIPGESDRRF